MEKSELSNLQGFVIASSYWNFFEVENLELDETRDIKLEFYGTKFNEKIKKTRKQSPAARILFSKELRNLIGSIFLEWKDNKYEEMSQKNRNPVMVFKKIDKDLYQLDFEIFDDKTIENKKEIISKKYQKYRDIINKIKNYISTQNFNYEDGMIENFYLSLKTKPFVMLAGISGTGKTKLVELFAKAIGCENNFDIIPVKPDWSDTSDLLGYKNLKGEFNPGPLMDIIVKANADEEDKIHFVCLDEMNLARVEYYFSDFLSIMETRHFDSGNIKSNPLFKEDYFEKDTDKDKYAGVYFPQNLYFIGTVNMDETTYPFSKKVLDRGNTIEFSNVDLTDYTLSNNDFSYEPIQVENNFLVSEKLTINDCNLNEKELIDKVVKLLAKVNEILKSESIHFGYRIRDEVVFYMLYNSKYNLLDFDEALDFQLMQKILPRIQGSTNSIKNILLSLLEFCGFNNLSTEEGMINHLLTEEKLEACNYKRTATKLAYMIKKLEVDGFTSYWL
jgi:energy-coupling factor transporter ATP-binding protein EcfA2